MKLQSLINSQLGVGLGYLIGKIIPPGLGYRLADWAARWLAHRPHLAIVRTVRANQWVVEQGQMSLPALTERTRAIFRHTGRCLYDTYHSMDRADRIRGMVRLSPEMEALYRDNQAAGRGVLCVAPHLSNFDLAGRALKLYGLDFLVLSYPNPSGGYRWQNELRRRVGVNIVPLSQTSLRQAVEHLRGGGFVLTGVDRPISGSNYRPRFFGRPSSVPVSHVRLALKTRVPVVVVACVVRPDGCYWIEASDPIEMRPEPDLSAEILNNAERILQTVEQMIRQAPSQWAMFYPVWPEALDEVPVR
jgi:KDO2-lipid IV(A) lauroyltransferase